jgi:hypothetical protein
MAFRDGALPFNLDIFFTIAFAITISSRRRGAVNMRFT